MKIDVVGNKLEITEAIENYVEKKSTSLNKFFDKILDMKVILGMETQHRNKGEIFFAEGKIEVPGKVLFAKKTAKDLYAAIDIMRDELESEIKKYKQKIRGNTKKNKTVSRDNKEYHVTESEEV